MRIFQRIPEFSARIEFLTLAISCGLLLSCGSSLKFVPGVSGDLKVKNEVIKDEAEGSPNTEFGGQTGDLDSVGASEPSEVSGEPVSSGTPETAADSAGESEKVEENQEAMDAPAEMSLVEKPAAGSDSAKKNDDDDDGDDYDDDDDQEKAKNPDSTDQNYSCNLAENSGPVQKFKVSGNSDVVHTITAGSGIHLIISGNSRVELTGENTSDLRGICIESRGNSKAIINIQAISGGIDYFGRGDSSVKINAADGVSFQFLKADISGNNSLEISGKDVGCSQAEILLGGNGTFNCMN